MVRANAAISNFAGGELSPLMQGRNDLTVYKRSLATSLNFVPLPQGAIRFRTGTKFVHHTRRHKKAVLIEFQFSDQQAYVIEATDMYFRFYKDEAIILEATKNVTGITQANPGVVTSASHGYNNGDEVFLYSVGGMTQVNGRSFVVTNKTTNTFELYDSFGNAVDTSGFGAYTSGGTAARVYEIATPYAEADLATLLYSQNADTMYITHKTYAPRKLTRTGHTSWTLATYSRTADPFTGAGDYPRAVSFTEDGRLEMAGTTNNPETIWGSKSPNPTTGAARYDDFTIGTAADDAFKFTLAPVQGKTDTIQWLTSTDKFMVAGTFSTVRRLYGAAESEPVAPGEITAKSANSYGCSLVAPVSNGTSLFYVQRSGLILRSFEFDYVVDGYVTTDRNLVAEHITKPGLIQLINQQANPDVLWSIRMDGILLGLTYKEKEDISGWHRHKLGGTHQTSAGVTLPRANVLWGASMPRSTKHDQLWLCVERRINGQTWRSVEYFTDYPDYPEMVEFYTGINNETSDVGKYQNALYEAQKQAVHLDMALTYDGATYGKDASATLTFSAATGTGVTVTASSAVFTASMVGREIWKKYDETGNGGGRAIITGYTSSTVVTVDIKVDLDNTAAIPVGGWYLTAQTITNIHHLEGQTVNVLTDGGPHIDCLVTGGQITLEYAASVVHIGYKYTGIVKSLNIDVGGVTGSAQGKPRKIVKTVFRFANSLGASMGTSLYKAEKLIFTTTAQKLNRPAPLFNGSKEQTYEDSTEIEKSLVIIQEYPLPCTVLVADVFAETSDE